MPYLIGIDTGGTFTDCVVVGQDGRIYSAKAPTTVTDLSQGILEAVSKAATSVGLSMENLLRDTVVFCQASTIGTNIFLTRSGARTGLLTTAGFEEIILWMRSKGRFAGLSEEEIKHVVKTYKPDPIVPRRLIKGLRERVDYKGQVLIPLDIEDTRRAVKELLDDGVEAIAISLLWSFVSPSHERQVRDIIREMSPGTYISLSSELVPKLGEYERTSTTVIDAYIGSANARFVSNLVSGLKDRGFKYVPMFAQGYGGCVAPEAAVSRPVGSISSGPAMGVMAAKHLAELLGYENVITADVGGTSFDVGLIFGGIPTLENKPVVGQYDLLVPLIEVTSIGAGGGSIARVEPETGVLKVGPASAGAVPGPVCYDRGGTEPTVTDANLVLGIVNPDNFLGGQMKLNREKAWGAIEERIAKPMGMDTLAAAAGIFDVANAQMSDLVRLVTVGRGYDPRTCVVFAYGGAGPVHAAFFGKEAREVVVPSTASVHSALGPLVTDILHVYEMSDPMRVPLGLDRVREHFQALEARALEDLAKEGFKDDQIALERFMDMKYVRQVHELRLPVPPGKLDEASLEQVYADFGAAYEKSYGKGAGYSDAGLQVVGFMVYGRGKTWKPGMAKQKLGSADPKAANRGNRPIYLRKYGESVEAGVYDYTDLKPGNIVSGLAIIEAPTTTILVDGDQQARMDEYGNVHIKFH